MRQWCKERGIEVNSKNRLVYQQADIHCLSIAIEDVTKLAEYLMPAWIDVSFNGALFWIREKGIWGEFSESTGSKILSQLRLANGEAKPFENTPCSLCTKDEIFELHSFFLLPLIFGWDAFLVPEDASYEVFVSHDGFVGVACRTSEKYEEIKGRLHDWHPDQDASWYSG
jgi:hypothetical protein